jgi:GNAT superfamily N-acetyltransferase
MSWTLRAARPDDAELIASIQSEGFEGYRSFAPSGWEPPGSDLELMRSRLEGTDVWCLIAEAAGEPAGHVALIAASLHGSEPSQQPGLGHVWQLFVRPPFWGTGLASELHARMVEAAAARGFSELRLYAAAGQARARRFYEREGWVAATDEFDGMDFGMPLVEYRRAINISV